MKTINRYNYEEFFLLYVDDELDAAEREAVEKFAEQNADLSVELDMLRQTRVMPEHGIVFSNKESLVRTEGNSINETNFEEYFLLYIDNELSAAKKQEVETYILQHPRLQDEFILLKQAVLPPETIAYSNKEELYRTEGRRIVHFKPWRLAAAAAFIGLCATGWWLMQRPNSPNTVADVPKVVEGIKKDTQSVVPVIPQQDVKQPEVAVQQATLPDSKETLRKTEVPSEKRQSNNLAHNQANNRVSQSNNETVTHDIIKQENQPLIAKNDGVKMPDQSMQEGSIVDEIPQAAESTEPNNSGFNVYPVAYKEINTDDEDQSVHVAMLDLNKNKVKSFLKKAGRLFNNKSNDLANEDGKLQVANFEIETNKQ